jgi:hypothetical protein
MRRSAVVAASALIAAAALIGLPGPANSTAPSPAGEPPAAAFMQLSIATGASAEQPVAQQDAALRADGFLGADAALVERGSAPSGPTAKPKIRQPSVNPGTDWKPPLYRLTGIATFYDNGTTAMRLPRGTVVRICGAGGCVLRVVNDYGPRSPGRLIDLYRPDFFAVCGCASWSGTTTVTVSVY